MHGLWSTDPKWRPSRKEEQQQLLGAGMQQPVLVIDDDPDIRQVLQDRLESYGYLVASAPDAPTALNFLEQVIPRGLFLDIRMPGMDGLEALVRIRAQHPSIPVVIITATNAGGNVTAALDAGAQACLLKPFDTSQLKRVAERWFETPPEDARPDDHPCSG